jgi:hypothetical protein
VGRVPTRGRNGSGNGEKPNEQNLNVENFHYYGNDLRELGKIADSNPDLANKIVDQNDKFNARHHGSYRFGLVASLLLVVATLGTIAYLMVNVGMMATIGAVGIILGVALMIRVILTGQWSETSWVGKTFQVLAKALGASNTSEK